MTARSRLERQMIAAAASGRGRDVPEAGRLIWGWFCTLTRTRAIGMAGPCPITFAEIEAFARLYRWPLEPRHVTLLLDMDGAYLDELYRSRKPITDEVPNDKRPPLTVAAFDAMFG